MELKDILKIYIKRKRLIIIGGLIGGLLGYGFFFLPQKYISTGSFYITRKAEEPSDEFFKYEGYYSQQAALSYTNTIVALLESLDVTSKSLENLGIQPTERNLRRYQKLVKVVKAGPQVITLNIREKTYTQSKDLWNTLSDTMIEESIEMNKRGDTNLSVFKVSEEPVVKEGYKSLPLDIIVGMLVGTTGIIFYIAMKEYLMEEKK